MSISSLGIKPANHRRAPFSPLIFLPVALQPFCTLKSTRTVRIARSLSYDGSETTSRLGTIAHANGLPDLRRSTFTSRRIANAFGRSRPLNEPCPSPFDLGRGEDRFDGKSFHEGEPSTNYFSPSGCFPRPRCTKYASLVGIHRHRTYYSANELLPDGEPILSFSTPSSGKVARLSSRGDSR